MELPKAGASLRNFTKFVNACGVVRKQPVGTGSSLPCGSWASKSESQLWRKYICLLALDLDSFLFKSNLGLTKITCCLTGTDECVHGISAYSLLSIFLTVCASACIDTCEGQRSILGVFVYFSPPYLFETGSLPEPKIYQLPLVAVQGAMGILLPLPPSAHVQCPSSL